MSSKIRIAACRRWIAIAGLCVLATLVSLAGTNEGTAVVPSNEYFRVYTELALSHAAGKSAHLDVKLPYFEIYDKQGMLVYHEDDLAKNTAVLRGLPTTLQGLKIEQAYHLTYREMLSLVPAFRAREATLLTSDRYTVIAVMMDKCSKCAGEEALITQLRKDSDRIPLRVLQIVLTHP